MPRLRRVELVLPIKITGAIQSYIKAKEAKFKDELPGLKINFDQTVLFMLVKSLKDCGFDPDEKKSSRRKPTKKDK